jgi:hypothetical protein
MDPNECDYFLSLVYKHVQNGGTTLSIMTFSLTTLSITTLSIKTLKTLNIKTLNI